MIKMIWLFRWPLAVLLGLGLIIYWPAIALNFSAIVLGVVVVILVAIAAWVLVRLPIGRTEIYHIHDLQNSSLTTYGFRRVDGQDHEKEA